MHTKRIRRALLWFRAFLAGVQGSLERTYPLRPESVSRRYHVVTDASPWGIGGVLYSQGAPVSHFSDQLHEEDLRRFQARRGDPAFSTLWEAMAILVALRCWAPFFTHDTAVTVRSDSHGSLSAMAKPSSPSPCLNLVMAEMALDASELACGLIPVDQLVHIPGASNAVADPLSRMFSPSPLAFPTGHARSVPATPPFRDSAYMLAHQTGSDPTQQDVSRTRRVGSPSAGWIPTPSRLRVNALMSHIRRGRTRTYRERGRALLFELARAEDSLVGVTMGPRGFGERAELPERPSVAPERRADRSRSRPRKRGLKDKDLRKHVHVVIDPLWINGLGASDPLWLAHDDEPRPQRAPVAPSCLHPMRLSQWATTQDRLWACSRMKFAASSRASSSPPLRRAPAECLAAWWNASMQRPPSDFGAEPPRPPPAAPAGPASDYPGDREPIDVSPPEGAAPDAPSGVFAGWEPAEPPRPPPAASAGP